MEKIKVIHIITRFDKGGSAENTFLTVMGLAEERYEATLIKGLSFESDMTNGEAKAVERNLAEVEREGIRIITIPELVRRIHPYYDLKALFILIRIFHRERPHIVHTHTSKTGILGRWAAFFAGVPVIIHTPHGHIFWGYFGRLKTRVYILLEKFSALITDKLVMLTEQEKKDHLGVHVAPEEKFTVVHSGVNLGRFKKVIVDPSEMKRKLGIPENSLVVGTAGRLTPVKGPEYLIYAAKEITAVRRDVSFVFLGDGELRDQLDAMVEQLGLKENVKFLGWRQDVADVMSVFDIFVLPSLNEGMGRVLVEAMALGKPVVATDVGGITNLVVDGKNGLLVPVADSQVLASELEFLMTNSKKRKEMGLEGKRMAVSYNVDSMVQKIDKLYVELLKRKISVDGLMT